MPTHKAKVNNENWATTPETVYTQNVDEWLSCFNRKILTSITIVVIVIGVIIIIIITPLPFCHRISHIWFISAWKWWNADCSTDYDYDTNQRRLTTCWFVLITIKWNLMLKQIVIEFRFWDFSCTCETTE